MIQLLYGSTCSKLRLQLLLVSLRSRSTTWLNFCRTTGAVVSCSLASPSLSYPSLFVFVDDERGRHHRSQVVSLPLWHKILLKSSMSRNYVIVDLGVENQSVLLPLQFHISFAIAPVKLHDWFDLIWYLFVFEFKMACAICRYGHHPPSSVNTTTRKVCATIFCRLFFYNIHFHLLHVACHQQINT